MKTNEFVEDGSNTGAVWTEAETLLLLESVLKHGDDWELVAQNVQTKTKLDCILKLVELPFGDSLLCSEAQRNEVSGSTNNLTSEKEITDAPTNNQEIAGSEDQGTKDINEDKDEENQGPPKRQCTAYVQDTSSSLMKQVGFMYHVSILIPFKLIHLTVLYRSEVKLLRFIFSIAEWCPIK